MESLQANLKRVNEDGEEYEITEEAIKAGLELKKHMLIDDIKNLEDEKSRLLLNVKDLTDKLEQQQNDQRDMYFYLNKKLDDNFEVISSLEQQLVRYFF